MVDYWIRKIDEMYNPERDIFRSADGVEVTWVDKYLLNIIEDLRSDIKQLESKVDELQKLTVES